ncbi:sensor histidine kinase [Microlunatus capsulatus]|uniref:histidine kinase n=1 Tax=Microlunatus capsulatus TaxID=99117 RepID=A0ABS4Z7M2_9ACTN|nr:sensor histidine kinase [Microlunatus capsulatus]MBP2417006.1 signal transduction histidine kinase [Microlunatus capsulatus]
MTSTDLAPGVPGTDVLDLYDALPPLAGPAPTRQDDPVTSLMTDVSRNTGVLVGTFAVYLAAFVVCTTLVSAGLGLAVLLVGLFLLLAALVVAGWAARMSRALLASAGHALPPTRYPAAGPGLRGRLRRLTSVQAWRDLLHVLVNFPVSVVTFSLALTWVLGGLGGVTYWFWSRFLPEGNQGLPDLLGFPGRLADVSVNTVVGVLLLVSTPVVLRGLVRLHVALARALVVDEAGALRERVDALTESRSAAGGAEVDTLRRLERDLHDGPQQRLVRLGMDISAAQRRLDDDPVRARALLDEALQQSQDALAEIRTLSRGIAPPILAEQGLRAAVTALAARGSIPTRVDVADVRLSDAAQNAAYFVVAEALTNVEKHSGASHASVEVAAVGGLAVVVVGDDGTGGAALAKGHGLSGLADRLAGVDGTLTVDSPAGGPTQLTATLPQSRG